MNQTIFENLPRKMNLISDLFSRVVFRDKEACQDLVRIILGEGYEVTEVTSQYDITNLQYRSVVLDILAETAGEEPIHVEFQISDDDDHMRRVRYCNGSIDTHLLQKGKAYKELPDVYHIYITMNDFIGGGQTVYEIFRTVRDREETYSTQYPVGNGVHELYINLEIPLGDGSELDHLLRYIKETTEENEDACFGHIVKSVKECREGEDEIMKYYSSHEFFEEGKKEGLEEGRKEGREEGREEGIEQGEKRTQNSIIKKMLSMGQPLEFISECTDKPVEYIRDIATEELMLVREENTYDRNIEKKSVE